MSLRSFFILLFSVFCAACATGEPAGRIDSASSKPLEQVSLSDYRLGAGDQLRIIVYDEPTLSSEFVVSPQGKISFPLVGEVVAGGLTITEFTTTLGDRLRQGYVKNPQVSAEVLTYRPFYILGQVQRPGTYPFAAELTVMNAVATAGGFTYRADTRRVYIKHVGQERETAYTLSSKTMVQPGDTVRIGERIF